MVKDRQPGNGITSFYDGARTSGQGEAMKRHKRILGSPKDMRSAWRCNHERTWHRPNVQEGYSYFLGWSEKPQPKTISGAKGVWKVPDEKKSKWRTR